MQRFKLLFIITILLHNFSYASTCSLSNDQYQRRIKFLEDQIDLHTDIYLEYKGYYNSAREGLKAMRTAHNISTGSLIVSGLALTYVSASIGIATMVRGGAIKANVLGIPTIFATESTATLLTTGEVLTIGPMIKGMTYFTIARSAVMLPADVYMIYRDLYGDHENFGASITKDQVDSLMTNSNLYPESAKTFFTDPNWNGTSKHLEHENIDTMANSLNEFYVKKLAEIDNTDTFWNNIMEFWNKKGLKEFALKAQVFEIAVDIQKFRIFYFRTLLNKMRSEQAICNLTTLYPQESCN
jgi:hypothetical protein